MLDITKDPSDVNNISLLTLVKNEPLIIKKEMCSSEVENPSSSDRGISSPDCPNIEIKVEVLDEAHFREDEGSVGPGWLSYPDALTKQELDIGPTELQPRDIQYMLQPCKPDPDYHNQQQFTEDIPQGQVLLVVKREDFTQQPDHDLLQNSPRSLSQGLCGPISQYDGQRVKIVTQPAYTDASKTNYPNTIELLSHTSRVPAPVVPHDTTHREDVNVATSHSSRENACDVHSKKYKCEYCHKVFSWKYILLGHMRVHESCGKKLSIISDLTRHMQVHANEEPYQCNSCDKKFAQLSTLTTHVLVHTGDKPYQCMSCDKKFNKKSKLIVHRRVHTGEKPYQCNTCNKGFTSLTNLTRHIQMHTGEKPYQCNICDKKFATKSHLTKHIRVHTGEKPYQCNICDKKFATKSHLTEHLRVHTSEKPYKCNTCEKKFSVTSSLTSHMRVHTGIKPYQCNTCDKKFASSSNLNKHIRVHTGEKPYKCNTCEKKFSVTSSLTIHMRVHTGEKPYQCNTCDKKFATKSHLTAHTVTM